MSPGEAGCYTLGGVRIPVTSKVRLERAETGGVGCHQCPAEAHGKEGVDGSSASEGSAKAPQKGSFSDQLALSAA
jgi:hypothetical protein